MREGNGMAAKNGCSLPQRPRFFKFLFPSLLATLRIPSKFYRHLPSELPKEAALLCPHYEIWNVEVCQAGPDIFFQRGWPEFMKAHDMHTGYLLLFQYNGNMKFEVRVFDTTCCLKDYTLKHCTSAVPPCIEIEDSSTNEDPALSDTSDGETHYLASLGGEKKCAIGKVQMMDKEQSHVHGVQIVGASGKKPACIEIDESSESEGQTISKNSHVDSLSERINVSKSNDKEKEVLEKDERVVQMEVQSKKTSKTSHNATSFAQFEKILTPAMVESHIIGVPRKFCVKNDLVTNRTIFLKRKLEGDGKVVPREWPVGFFFGPRESRIRNGWRMFSKENSLKIGDRCIFQLVSRDTILVETHGLANSLGGKTKYIDGKAQGVANEENRPSPQQNNVWREKIVGGSCKRPAFIDIQDLSKSNDQTISKISDEIPSNYLSKRRKLSNSIGKEEEDDKEAVLNIAQGKKKTNPNFICFDQFEKMLTRTMVESHYINLPRAFCVKNDLVTSRPIFLQKKLEVEGNVVPGKWPAWLCFGPLDCRIGKGWKIFSKETSLKIGDRCIFQLISKDTFIVQTMPPESLSIKREDGLSYQRASSPAIASTKKQIARGGKDQKNNLQCECIIKGYNLENFLSLRKAFCKANGLIREQTIFLKRSIDGKTWSVGFRPRKSEGRLTAGWKDFARENVLEEGDKCTFQLMSKSTLHVDIARKCRKRDAVRNNWRSGRQNTIDESEFSVTVRQFHLTYNYMTIPISFCRRNELTTRCQMVLKTPEGKMWHVNYYLNGYKEGRFNSDGWRKFACENELKERHKVFFKLVAKETMLVRVVKA